MRVIQVGAYPPPHGGLQTNLVGIRDCLRRQGHCCAAINITRHRRPDADDVYYPKTGLGVLRLLWTLPSDIVHVHIGGDLNPHLLGLCLACTLLPGRRAVLSFHSGGYPSSPQGRTAQPWGLRGIIFRRLDHVIAVNAEIASFFERLGLPRERVSLIPPYGAPALDPNAALPEPVQRFFRSRGPVLTTVGLLEREYDLGLQIEALGPMLREFPNAGLAIIGSGSLEPDLRNLIARQPWSDHILLCGDVPHAATLRAIAESDLLLRTTLYDGDAISIREALALGTPVVATDNGMRPEGIRRIPVSDGAALAREATTALRAGGNRVANADSGTGNFEAVVRLYGELIAAGKR